MNPCPDEARLALIESGALPTGAEQAHLAGCTECHRTLEQWRQNTLLLHHLTPGDQPGTTLSFGPYTQCVRVAEGGMSTVYLGLAPYGRQVAVKVCRLQAHLPYFEREVEWLKKCATAGIPGVAPLLDADLGHLPAYLVTPFCQSGTLAQKIAREGPLPAPALVRLALALARTLADLATHGILHGDIKPTNILMDEAGHPCLTDLGVARRLLETHGQSHTLLTRLGHAPVTAAYMSPEQARGQALTPAADIFSLGVVLYEAATGLHPFAGATPWEQAAHILTREVAALPDYLPEPLVKLILQCLSKESNKRPSAADIAGKTAENLLAGIFSPPVVRNATDDARLRHQHDAPPRPVRQSTVLKPIIIAMLIVTPILVLSLTFGLPHRLSIVSTEQDLLAPAGPQAGTADKAQAQGESDADYHTRLMLTEKTMTAQYNSESLEKVIQDIRDATQANIWVSWDTLENSAGISRDKPVTLQLKNVSAADLLKFVLRGASGNTEPDNCTNYAIENGVIVVDTVKNLQAHKDAEKTKPQAGANDKGPVQGESDADYRTRLMLTEKTMTAQYNGESLEKVIQDIRDATQANIWVSWDTPENNACISRDKPVTLQLKNVSAADILKFVLRGASGNAEPDNCTNYAIENGVIVVDTVKNLQAHKDADKTKP